jgi:hypothetical protein
LERFYQNIIVPREARHNNILVLVNQVHLLLGDWLKK